MFVSQIIIIFADAYQKVLQTKVEGYMTKREISKLFEDRKIRTVWDDKEEKWYFSIVDVVAVLTDSADPKQYIKRMKSRDEGLKANWGTICTLVPLVSEDGKNHKEMKADTTG